MLRREGARLCLRSCSEVVVRCAGILEPIDRTGRCTGDRVHTRARARARARSHTRVSSRIFSHMHRRPLQPLALAPEH